MCTSDRTTQGYLPILNREPPSHRRYSRRAIFLRRSPLKARGSEGEEKKNRSCVTDLFLFRTNPTIATVDFNLRLRYLTLEITVSIYRVIQSACH